MPKFFKVILESTKQTLDASLIGFVKGTNGNYLTYNGDDYGKQPDLSGLPTQENYDELQEQIDETIKKNSLATINNQSLENGGNISIDLGLYKICPDGLPTENIDASKIYLVPNGKTTTGKNMFDEYIYLESESVGVWELMGTLQTEIDLSEYIKTVDADKKYMTKVNGSASISIPSNGQLNNFSASGQAFCAVRDLSSTTKWKTGSGYPLNAAAFGVKDDGTCAFSHKKYDTFVPATGAVTGAKNTAVLTFSGNSGLRYAKNTGSGNDVTEDMYKYVGVIDSPDANQKVYSAKQVDDLLAQLKQEIIDELTNS